MDQSHSLYDPGNGPLDKEGLVGDPGVAKVRYWTQLALSRVRSLGVSGLESPSSSTLDRVLSSSDPVPRKGSRSKGVPSFLNP